MEDKNLERKDYIYLGITVLMAGLWAFVGYDIGYRKGYFKGLTEYRKMHIDIVKTVMDEAACDAAFESLNLVRSDPSKYELLMKDPGAVLVDAQKIFYERDNVKALLESLKNWESK